MAVTVVCPACGGKLSAPSQLLGRMAKCPQCGQAVKVAPSKESTAEPPRPVPSRKPRSLPSEPDDEAAEIVIRRSSGREERTDDSEAPSPGLRIAYGLGIPSVVLGILAFSFSWIPRVGLLGLPLSGLGLLLGIAGLVIAITHRGRGIGFPIAGSAVSFVALVIGVFWLGLLGTAFQRADTAAQQNAAKAILAEADLEKNIVVPIKSSAEKEAPWTDASKGAIQHGDFRVQLGAVVVRNVRIKDVLGDETVSPTKNLTIQVFLDNMNATRKLDYQGWSGATANVVGLADLLGGAARNKGTTSESPSASESTAASLTDNFGNSYKRLSLDLGAQVPGQITSATSVYPGKRIEDLLVFEPPIDKLQYLRLNLPATAFGGTGNVRLQIPKAMIYR